MIYFVCILLYLTVLIGYGIYRGHKHVKTQEDFAVAGRTLPTFVLFGTLVATWIGTGSIFGVAEKAYNSGIIALVLLLPSFLGITALYFLAGKVRRLKQVTIQDILEIRYGPAARVFGVITLVIAYTTIVSYQYRAAGAVLNLTLPSVSPETGALIAAVFIIAFTASAGLMSVAYTDLIQGITMIVGLAICVPILWFKAGGPSGVMEALPKENFQFFGQLTWIQALGLVLPSFLLVLGDANMYQRFFAARSEGTARKAVWFMIFGVLFIDACIIFAGIAGRALQPELDIPGKVIAFAARDYLPLILGIVMLTAIAAIIVSTADSYLLSPATAVVRDIYQRFFRKDASPKEFVMISRVVVVILGIIAYVLSTAGGGFLKVALYAYTVYGAGITPALIAALLWKRVTAPGALSSIIGGTTMTLAWEICGWGKIVPGWLGLAEGREIDTVLPAILVSTLLLVGVSLATKRQGSEKLSPFGLE